MSGVAYLRPFDDKDVINEPTGMCLRRVSGGQLPTSGKRAAFSVHRTQNPRPCAIKAFRLASMSLPLRLGVGWTVAVSLRWYGGKSGLHRAECQVTPGGCEPTESAAESRPPKRASAGKGER